MPDYIHGDFEWNIDKDLKNIAKHGIAFMEATRVFDLENYYSEPYLHKSGEIRGFCISVLGSSEITVIYTMRGTRKRLMSARRASNEERLLFYRNRGRK